MFWFWQAVGKVVDLKSFSVKISFFYKNKAGLVDAAAQTLLKGLTALQH